MIRMAVDGEGNILMDADGTFPGRGAYVCRKKECIDGLAQGGRIAREFRKKGKVQAGPEALKGLMKKLTELVSPG